MDSQPRHRKLVALAGVAVTIVAVLGGTSYAASRPSHSARAPHAAQPLSKHDVKQLIKTYVNKHAPAKPVPFAVSTSSSGPVTSFGAWQLSETCNAQGVAVSVSGPGIVFGTNSIAAVDGPAGSTFETAGSQGGTNSAGPGFQANQTLLLIDNSGNTESLTYIANADTSTPTNCDIVGYALAL